MKKAAALLLLITLCVLSYLATDTPDQDPYLITDYSRLHPVKVERVVKGREDEQLIRLVREARQQHKTVSIAGQRHSQGGHTYYKDGIVVDMTSFNEILEIDPAKRRIRVQSGAIWEDVQNAVGPYGLSVKTMQSQNIFTVGGSISINAHGRDIRHGSMIKSVESFRLLTASGEILNVSRSENAGLFPLALGGYGLFGIILDVTLTLTEDEIYTITTDNTTVEQYSRYFQNKVLTDPDIHMHIARISVAPDSFLSDMYTANYKVNRSLLLKDHNKLQTREKGVIPSKILFQLNRSFDWGKNAFWRLQVMWNRQQDGKSISRNNAMRSESEFMEYTRPGNNDLLQEYFIPVDQFDEFIQDMKKVLKEEDLNLLNITVRYINQDQEAVLSYAKEDMFALVCLFHVSLSDREQMRTAKSIRKLLDEVIRHNGAYYLPYAAYPSIEQFQFVYPRHEQFFRTKEKYDPKKLFTNYFYEQYGGLDS